MKTIDAYLYSPLPGWICFWYQFHLYKIAPTSAFHDWVVGRWGTDLGSWPSPWTVYFDNV